MFQFFANIFGYLLDFINNLVGNYFVYCSYKTINVASVNKATKNYEKDG